MKDDDRNTLDRRRFLKVAGAQTGLLLATAKGAGAVDQQQQPQQPTPRRAPAVIGQKSPDIAVIGAGAFGGGVPPWIQPVSFASAAFITYFWFARFGVKVQLVAG